jgi:hypothetical protein
LRVDSKANLIVAAFAVAELWQCIAFGLAAILAWLCFAISFKAMPFKLRPIQAASRTVSHPEPKLFVAIVGSMGNSVLPE